MTWILILIQFLALFFNDLYIIIGAVILFDIDGVVLGVLDFESIEGIVLLVMNSFNL